MNIHWFKTYVLKLIEWNNEINFKYISCIYTLSTSAKQHLINFQRRADEPKINFEQNIKYKSKLTIDI